MKQDNRNREEPAQALKQAAGAGEPEKNAFVPESFSADYRGQSSLPLHREEEAREAERAEEMDKELDDFLPEGESLPEEEFLTKWGRELEEAGEGSGTEGEEAPSALPEEAASGAVPGAASATALRQRRPQGRRWYGLLAGSVVLLLALTGVVFLAWMAGSSLHARFTDDSQLRAYDDFLMPVVMLDPEPFASPDKAGNTFVQEASLWKAILDDGGSRYTQYDDNGRVIIPLGDVAAACVSLFGPDRNLSPGTPGEESFYTYDEEDNSYHVALFSSDSMVTPYTEKSYSEDGKTVLRVGYVSPTDEWRTGGSSSGSPDSPKPTKYMEYVLAENPDTGASYIYAVRAVED